MVICFKGSRQIKDLLDRLVGTKAYSDYSEAIAAALGNLLVLQEEMDKGGQVCMTGESPVYQASESRSGYGPTQDVTPSAAVQTDPSLNVHERSLVPASYTEARAVPELFCQLESRKRPAGLAMLPGDEFSKRQPVPLDRWIFGQFSKLLPVKASCRALARITFDQGPGHNLDKTASRLAKEATSLASLLAEQDRGLGLGRDDAFAVGFPSSGAKADKSRMRFANQYVGAFAKRGQPAGLPFDLKLLNLARESSTKVALTEPGWDFAALQNPVLDTSARIGLKFSEDEIAFLLSHISEHVPVEDFAFRTLLTAILSGADTPSKLDEVCRAHLSPERAAVLSDAFVTTQRTGVISRLADLGMIQRHREGVRVAYLLTTRGREYVDRSAAA